MDTPTKKVNKWFIGYRKLDEPDYTIVPSPADHYFADPFLVKHNDVNYLFFEDYDYTVGSIAYGILTDGGFEYGQKVLEGSHFSFPSVIESEGEYYMTPENGDINLYKATRFPDKWEKIESIASGAYADPVLVKNGEEWLCLASSPDNYLVIFRADKDLKGWHEIFRGEFANSRNAGHVIRLGEELIRPVQDCVNGYGLGVILKKITLAPYTEKEFDRLEDWLPGSNGFHTYNANEDYEVVDARIRL